MFVDALFLESVQLEEIGQPKHVLHQVDVLALLVLVARSPKHFVGVHEIQYDSKGLGCRPQRQQDSDLLRIVYALDDVSELL